MGFIESLKRSNQWCSCEIKVVCSCLGWDTLTDRSWLVWITLVTLLFLAMLIKDVWIFAWRGIWRGRERRLVGECQTERERERDRNLTQGLISMPFLFLRGNTVTAFSKLQTPFPQMLLLEFKDTLQIQYILPACQHHKGETLSINSTHSIEPFLFLFFFSL